MIIIKYETKNEFGDTLKNYICEILLIDHTLNLLLY